jgi:hypothetical protein
MIAAAAALVAMSAVMLAALRILDLYPLYSRRPLFFWSFATGGVLFAIGLRLIRYFRGLLDARDNDSQQ